MQIHDRQAVRSWLQERHDTVQRDLKTLQGRVEELLALMTELDTVKPEVMNGQSDPATRIIAALREAGRDGVRVTDIATLMDTPKTTAASRLRSLKAKGIVRHAKRRYYLARSAKAMKANDSAAHV